nr:hypothetical protein [Nocardia terpenica]
MQCFSLTDELVVLLPKVFPLDNLEGLPISLAALRLQRLTYGLGMFRSELQRLHRPRFHLPLVADCTLQRLIGLSRLFRVWLPALSQGVLELSRLFKGLPEGFRSLLLVQLP